MARKFGSKNGAPPWAEKAREMRARGVTCGVIKRVLGLSEHPGTVAYWAEPKRRDKMREDKRKWHLANYQHKRGPHRQKSNSATEAPNF